MKEIPKKCVGCGSLHINDDGSFWCYDYNNCDRGVEQ